jgi:hypothetical protein
MDGIKCQELNSKPLNALCAASLSNAPFQVGSLFKRGWTVYDAPWALQTPEAMSTHTHTHKHKHTQKHTHTHEVKVTSTLCALC